MIHSGAIVGAGLSQFKSLLFKSVKFPYRYFRSDRLAMACTSIQANNVIVYYIYNLKV